MKKILTLILLAIAFSTSAQYDKSNMMDAAENLEKFAKRQKTANGFYITGIGLSLVGVSTARSTGKVNPVAYVGTCAGLIGWIIDRSSYGLLHTSALYLKQADHSAGVSIGILF